MNLALISSSAFNLFAATLISKLISENRTPACVICAQKSKTAQVKKYFKKNGFLATVRKVLEVSNVGASKGNKIREALERYASDNGLEDWNLSLPNLCAKHGIEYRVVEGINKTETVEFVKQQEIDLILNAGGEIFRKRIIEASSHGVFNAHMGRLPEMRGFNVMEWSLFYRKPVGVTLHFIDPGIDTGDIIRFEEIPIQPGDDIDSLRAKSFAIDIELITSAIAELENGTLSRTPQEADGGKQYFAVHPRLKEIAERNIAGVGG